MQSKKKNIPKYVSGGLIAGGVQAALGIGQAAFGFNQRAQAKKAIDELQKNNPQLEVPTSLRKLVNEPIAEEYMEAQEMGGQRRTAQAIDTLGKGGSRTLGVVGNVLDNERIGEMQRAGQYEQARKQALGQMANAESNIQNMNFNKYMQDLEAARGALEGGQQNIFGGFGQVGRGTVSFGDNYTPTNNATFGDYTQAPYVNAQSKGLNFEDGGMMKTKGVFSHRKNPKDLVDRNTGEVEAELTGSETVFNEEDSNQMEALANKGKDKELAKFVKGKYKKFRSKRKSK